MRGVRTKVLVAVAGAALFGSVVGGAAVFAATQTFSDVPPDHPFYDEIEWGAANGVVNGYDDGTFKPANVVTRQAAVTFLSRYNGRLQTVKGSNSINNVSALTVDAICPPGTRVLAGGAYASPLGVAVTGSYPVTGGGLVASATNGVRWRVTLESINGATKSTMSGSAWALCAPPLTP